MAVQYNSKDNTWGGIVVDIKDAITTSKKQLSTESLDLFSNFNNNGEEFVKVRDKILDRGKFDEWCDSVEIASTAEKKFFKTWDGSGDIQEAFTAHLKKNTEGLTIFQRAGKAAGNAMKSLLASIGSMAAMWAIGEVLSLVATGIDSLLNQASNISEKAEGFASTMDAFNSSVKEGSSQIDDLAYKYEKLSEGVDNSGNNVSLTAEQYSEYKDTVSKLSDIMPDHISLLNAQGEKIGFVGGKLKDANKEYREYLKNQATSLLNDEDENGNSYKDTLDDYDIQSANASSGRQGIGYGIRQVLGSEGLDILPESIRKTFLDGVLISNIPNEILGTEDAYTTQQKIDVLNKLKGKQKKKWRKILGDGYYGDSKEANIVEDALDIDVDKLDEYTDDQLSQLLKTKIDNFQSQLDTKANNVAKGVSAMLVSDDDFDGLDESLQNNISTLVSSMNSDVLNGLRDNGVDVNDQLKLNTWINTFVDTIKSNKDGVQDALSSLFEIDTDTLNPIDAQKKIKEYLQIIAKAFFGKNFTQDNVNSLENILFPDAKESEKNYKASLKGFNLKVDKRVKEYRKVGVLNKPFEYTIEPVYKTVPEYDKERQKELEKWASKNNVTQEELNQLKNEGYGAAYSINELTKALKRYRSVKKDSKQSFFSIWNELKDSDQKSLKKSVLAGTFDQEELNKYQTLANNFSLKKVREEILNTIALDDKIGQFLNDTDKLTTAYQEMQKNGVVSTKTLQGMPDGLRNLEGYTDFRNTVSSSKVSKGDKKKAFEDLVSEYIDTNATIKGVTSETRDYVINALKDIGIVNAEELVDISINTKNASDEIENITTEECNNFLKALKTKNISTTDLYNTIGKSTAALINALGDNYAKDVKNFQKSFETKMKTMSSFASALSTLQTLEWQTSNSTSNYKMKSFFGGTAGGDTVDKNSKQYKEYVKAKNKADKLKKQYKKWSKKNKKDFAKLQAEMSKLKYNPTSSSSSNKKSGSNSSGSSTTNQIDWIERKLTVLSKKLDVAKSKYDALFATSKAKDSDTFVNQQNKALNEQIKIQDKVIAANNKAEKSYSKIAKKYAKKISSTHKNLVQYGGYTIENFTTKDTTKKSKKGKKGTKKVKVTKNEYDNIQKYIEYLDKVSDAQSNKSKAQQEKVNSQIEQKQNSQTRAETKQSMYKAQEENASGLSKNNYIKDQITQLTKSYNLQIEIAKLQKDYDKAKQLEAEKQKQINQLRYHEVENIKTAYENQVSLLDAQQKNIQANIDIATAKGDIISREYYNDLNKEESEKQKKYNTELSSLLAKQNNFTKYSDEWYSLQSDIQSVKDQINDSQKAVIENTKAVLELRDAMYDDISNTATNLDSEVDFLAGLVRGETTDSKTGKLTEAGLAQLYAAYASMQSFSVTAKEQEQRLKEYSEANAKGILLDGSTSLEQQKKTEQSIREKVQEAVNYVKDHGDKIIELMKTAIQESINYLQDMIDARKQVLSEEKDLYDYQKQLLEKTKNISSLQKQMLAVSGDYSEEGRLKAAQLRESLDEAQQDLQDTEYDKYISDQQEMLDNLMDEYKDLMENLQKDENALLAKGIKYAEENAKSAKDIYKRTADQWGYLTSSTFNAAIESGDGTTSIISTIQNECAKIINAYNNAQHSTGGTTGTSGSPSSSTTAQKTTGALGGRDQEYANSLDEIVKANSQRSKLLNILSDNNGSGTDKPIKRANKKKTYRSALNKKLSEYGYVVKDGNGASGTSYLKMFAIALGLAGDDGSYGKNGAVYKQLQKKFPSLGFDTGGIAKLIKNSNEDGIAFVRNGEGFVKPENVEDIRKLTALTPDITTLVNGLTNIPKMARQATSNNSVNIDKITFELPNVENAVDFTDTIQTPRQQKAFAAAIGDAINGNKLNINRY